MTSIKNEEKMSQKKNELIEIIVREKKMTIERQEKTHISEDSVMFKSLVGDAKRIVRELFDEIREECRGQCIEEIKTTFYSVFSQSEKEIKNIIINKMQQNTEVEAKAEAKVEINLKKDLPAIQTEFREFKREVTKLDDELDEELVDLEDDLLEITPASEEGKVNKAINKLSLFMQKLKDEDSRFSKIVKGTKKGMDLAQKLAVTYNKFARELGLDPVQDLFL